MTEGLTKRQRYWLKHIERAGERDETLKAYAKRHRLSVGALYHAKSQLLKVGACPGREPTALATPEFIPVQMEAAFTAGTVCRLRCRSGWEVECETWPDPQWLLAIMQGAQDDASS